MHTDTAAADEATIQALSATATAPGAASVLIEELQDASSSNAAQAPTLSSSDIMRFHHQGFKLVDVVQLTQKVNRHALDAAHACTVKSQQDADSLGRPRSPSQAAGVGAGDTTFEGVLLPPELDGRALGLDTDAGRLD